MNLRLVDIFWVPTVRLSISKCKWLRNILSFKFQYYLLFVHLKDEYTFYLDAEEEYVTTQIYYWLNPNSFAFKATYGMW